MIDEALDAIRVWIIADMQLAALRGAATDSNYWDALHGYETREVERLKAKAHEALRDVVLLLSGGEV